ncbi:ParA family protein [Marinobacter zhanjiangensis]|uniref:Chromosome partitioning protein Soj n=1 Tax=Marinobacter zhanjiangensis TaxID=578215 RepID=A0ABQ3ANB4_9GAMM|nr:ParA family protein [Marinobacter zhanjiangensis]GGY61683.1 chromosome partitioning protein Soj [Marinobacter zhanjiangensis]
MARVIAVTNQKGGVGKTTTCVNLAASLSATKRRVLLVDMDPQGNATMGSGVDKNGVALSGYDVLTKRARADEVIVSVENSGFDLLPANGDLTAAEVELMNEIGREHRLRLCLNAIRENYDYILIDCPPSLNLLTVNALSAADAVLIPMQCEYYALEGLAALMNTIEQIQETVNANLQVEGILRTMYDPRNSLTLDVSGQLSQYFGDKVYKAVIPRNVRLAEAPSYGLPALKYDRASKGAVAYLALAGEMVRRHSSQKTTGSVAV